MRRCCTVGKQSTHVFPELLNRVLYLWWQCWLSDTTLRGIHLCLLLIYWWPKSEVSPPVKSRLLTADKKPFYWPPASSISLQRNKMVMAYKTPVEKLRKGLTHRSILQLSHKHLWKCSPNYSSMIADLYNPTMTQTTRNINKLIGEPLRLKYCWSCGWCCPRCAVSERKWWKWWLRHSVELLCAVCMHACVWACTHARTCTCTVQASSL